MRLLDVAKGGWTVLRDAALVLLALDTGLRCAELAPLRGDAIDWSARIAKVMGKSGRERFVVFGPHAAKAMQRYPLKHRSRDSETFFTTEEGRALTTSNVHQRCASLGLRAGVPLNPHKLRRPYVTLSFRNGASPFLVQKHWGRRDLQTTLRDAHLSPDDLVAAPDASSPVASVLGRKR